jgi:hypothetical protein
MFLRRKFSPGFSRAVNHLLRSLPGIRHATGTAADPDAATTMEKLDAALNNMSHGLEPARAFFVSMESERGSEFLM